MVKELQASIRTIMTPGPVEAEPRVLRAMSTPILGQYDPEFFAMMNDVTNLLKMPFQTENEWALAVDGTARAGLEAAVCGIIEPGDKVLVPSFGRFGFLMAELAQRAGAQVKIVEQEWGTIFDPKTVIDEIKAYNPKMLIMVHGETSTGQMQDLKEIGLFCKENDVLFMVDAVATFTGADFQTDAWGVDIAVAGTQKCLSVPTGMAPVTYNAKVEKILASRYQVELGLTKDVRNDRFISSNYLDLSQIQQYWGPKHINHHTEMTSMIYALREGLRIVHEEGLENRFARHRKHEKAMMTGLNAMGLTLFGDMSSKMPTVTCVNIPEGLDGEAVRSTLLHHYGVEIASSFGSLAGKIWRIGNMGFSSRKENVLHTLNALEASITFHGGKIAKGEAAQAALKFYSEN